MTVVASETPPPVETIVFRLTSDELKRLRRRAFPGGSLVWLYALVGGLQLLRVPTLFMSHRQRPVWQIAFEAALTVVLILVYGVLFWLQRDRGRRIPTDGTLALSQSGFAGTLDGRVSTIAWRDIVSVQDIGDALVLTLRKRPVVILPMSAVPDVCALWALLEDRLVSKRGLIRSRPPRTVIQNSAY